MSQNTLKEMSPQERICQVLPWNVPRGEAVYWLPDNRLQRLELIILYLKYTFSSRLLRK